MKIVIPDKVSKTSAELFTDAQFDVTHKAGIDIKECSKLSKNADGIVVRSYKLHALEISSSLKAIGRAGSGVNNIPVNICTEKGVVVFNTPGANANAVKELVLCGLLMSSRNVVAGVNWLDTLRETDQDTARLVEKNKNMFKGSEIMGKKLGVIGLGSIGMLVANAAESLGMSVTGFDPFISVESAWQLSSTVKKANELNSMLAESDFLSLHVPLSVSTKGFLNKKLFLKMKKGIRVMNFSRGELVDGKDLVKALDNDIVIKYVTDFPSKELLGVKNVVCIPHLGASTAEAEENCAVMVANQMIDFMKNGNIKHSINFPNCFLDRNGETRLIIINQNIPAMIEKITKIIAEEKLNITEMINKSCGDIAYNIVDVSGSITEAALKKIGEAEGIIRVRKIM